MNIKIIRQINLKEKGRKFYLQVACGLGHGTKTFSAPCSLPFAHRHEALMVLKGGYNSCLCFCLTSMGEPLGYVNAQTSTCVLDCGLAFGSWATGYCNS